jgi:NAD(P)-dependent dehydrogenase (short-subunit alcohol dehydrogenase family)
MTNKRVALVTGANKGLGLEMARQLAQAGVKVLMGARDEGKGRAAVSKLKEESLEVEFILLDVTNSNHIDNAVNKIAKEYGKLDILINNAGLIQGEGWEGNSVETISLEDIRYTFDANFFSVVELTQKLLPLIRKSEAGRIVNMSSIMGSLALHADPNSHIYNSKPFAYDASKTALNQFTVHLAHALKDTNIKVNAAHPGWVKTELGTEYAPMDVKEGAKTGVDLALCGDDGPTGQYIHQGTILPW